MKREEELDWLCRLRSEIYVYMPKEWLIPMNNALDMAITALSQEQQSEWERDHEILKAYADGQESMKPCKDAISRADVLDLCESKDPNYAVIHFKEDVECLPPVSVAEKTGRWEEVQFRTIPYNRISKAKKCSVCGKRKDKYVTWNYCPNCGCRMMEVTE